MQKRSIIGITLGALYIHDNTSEYYLSVNKLGQYHYIYIYARVRVCVYVHVEISIRMARANRGLSQGLCWETPT